MNGELHTRHSPSYTQVGLTSTIVSCIWPSQVVGGSKRPYIHTFSHFAEIERRLVSQVSILRYKCLACRVPRLSTSSERSRLQVDDWVMTPRNHPLYRSPEEVTLEPTDVASQAQITHACPCVYVNIGFVRVRVRVCLQWRLNQWRLYRHVPNCLYGRRKPVACENTDHSNIIIIYTLS